MTKWCVVLLLSTVMLAQTNTLAKRAGGGDTPSASKPTGDGMQELRDGLAAQQKQIAAQQEQIRAQQRQIEGLTLELHQQETQHQAQPPNLGEVASTIPIVPGPASISSSQPIASNILGEQEMEKPSVSPLSFRIGGTEFTPGGFADFTTFFRSTNVGSGIATSFGSIPFSGTVAGQLSEIRLTSQTSRLSLKVTGSLGKTDIMGYVESDFLGFQPNNGLDTTNSNSFRQRLYWFDLHRGKWEVLGGESFSFLTPNRKGLSPLPADIFYTLDVDPIYQVGLTWTRAPQLRLIYHPSDHWATGVAFENPQQYIGSAVVLPSNLASTYAPQLDNGSLNNPGNLSTPNLHPDILPKIAYDTDIRGRHMHVELVGVVRSFKVFNQTLGGKTPSVIGGSTSTVTGGGGSLNFNLELVKNFHLITSSFYSSGGGRYIFGLAPDLVIRPDGTPGLLRSRSGVGGFEYQITPKTMLYGYYGGVYIDRSYFGDPKSPATIKFSGYGFPGSSANRAIQEGTFGIIQTFWKNPHYGALQLITQGSYVVRSPWSVNAGAPKNAHLGMGYVDLRYILP